MRAPTRRCWRTARWSRPAWRRRSQLPRRARASRSSTCGRCRRSTWSRSLHRYARPAGPSSSTRRRSPSASAPSSPPASPSTASTRWRRRCSGSAPSTRRTRRAGSKRSTCPTSTGCSTRSTVRSPTEPGGSQVSDTREFKLPDVGEGLTEAEIVSWKVKPGDAVKVNDIVVEIETAKSLVELPCPFGGTVAELMVPEGETVAVGTPIISVSTGAGGAAAAPAAAEPATAGVLPEASEIETPAGDEAIEPGLIGGPAPGGRTSVLVGYGPRTTEAKRRPRKSTAESVSSSAVRQDVHAAFSTGPVQAPEVPAEEAEPATPPVPAAKASPRPVRALAKPPVRKLAKDLGVDINTVAPSGPGGVVTRADVEAVANGAALTPAAAAPSVTGAPGAEETRIPVKGVRKMTAQAMVSSAFTAPHVTEWVTIDVSRTMRLVKRLRQQPEFRDVKVSPLLVIAKAVCLAVRRTPEVNATWDDAAGEIVLKHYVNLGIAAATPRGLVVPNVKGADRMSLRELADALGELVATARAGKTQPAEMSGGTFTITNVGVFGVDAGTPILNPGETGILAVGAIRKQPWVVGNRIRPRDVTTLALSFDHRVVDGEQGSRFLADVAELLKDPASALLY